MTSFKNHILASISDLELVNSSYYEESLCDYDLEETNNNVEFDPFILTCSNYSDFADDLSASSFLKETIETSSSKMSAMLNKMLTSTAKNSTDSTSLSSKKSFEPANRELSSEDTTYASNLHISNISFKSSFLFFKSFVKKIINHLSFDRFL